MRAPAELPCPPSPMRAAGEPRHLASGPFIKAEVGFAGRLPGASLRALATGELVESWLPRQRSLSRTRLEEVGGLGGLLWGLVFQSNHAWSIKLHAPGFSLSPTLNPNSSSSLSSSTSMTKCQTPSLRGWFLRARGRTVGTGHLRVCGEPHWGIILLC